MQKCASSTELTSNVISRAYSPVPLELPPSYELYQILEIYWPIQHEQETESSHYRVYCSQKSKEAPSAWVLDALLWRWDNKDYPLFGVFDRVRDVSGQSVFTKRDVLRKKRIHNADLILKNHLRYASQLARCLLVFRDKSLRDITVYHLWGEKLVQNLTYQRNSSYYTIPVQSEEWLSLYRLQVFAIRQFSPVYLWVCVAPAHTLLDQKSRHMVRASGSTSIILVHYCAYFIRDKIPIFFFCQRLKQVFLTKNI